MGPTGRARPTGNGSRARRTIRRTVPARHGEPFLVGSRSALSCDLPVAQPLAPARLAVKLPDAMQHCLLARVHAARLPALAPPGPSALAESRGAELRDDYGFLELADRAEHLMDQDAGCVPGLRRFSGLVLN
jgi:hypothetical protein